MTEPGRFYRFAPLDRAGWVLGLSGVQCVLIAAGIFASSLLLDAGAPAPAVMVPVIALSAATFARWRGRPVHEWVPVLLRFGALRATGRHRWTAPIPLLTKAGTNEQRQPPLPPFMRGLELLDAGAVTWCPSTAHAGVGAVRDRANGTVSASIPVRGRGFSLLERDDQDRLLQGWGDVLSGFCTERPLVSRVQVTEWAAPAGLGEHERFIARNAAPVANAEALASYCELLAEAGPMSVSHEALVTVTLDQRRVTRGRVGDAASGDGVVAALLDEMRLVSMRLEAAELAVGAPLSVARTAEALRLRCDPSCRPRLEARAATLAELTGLVSRYSAGPLASLVEWDHVRTDASLHRSYWVAEWPRLDVGPNWLEPFLLHSAGIRTFSMHFEPVPPSAAQRRIDRDSTRLAADEEQRSRAGFRIGARHRRTQAAVAEREAELVGGYAELGFAGFVTVTAPDEDALAIACGGYEQAAAQSGLELRALDGQHDLGLVCSLPLGRGPAARGLA